METELNMTCQVVAGRVVLQSDIERVTTGMHSEFEAFGSEHFELADVHFAQDRDADPPTVLRKHHEIQVSTCQRLKEHLHRMGLATASSAVHSIHRN